jgi:transposase-like protein
MDSKQKSYTPEFNLKVVLESMQRDTTQEEVCKKFGISSSMLHRWRKEGQNCAFWKSMSIVEDKLSPATIGWLLRWLRA